MRPPKLRLWPASLLGQTLLALALALLVAQSISAVLLWRGAENRLEQALLNTAAFRLIGGPPPEHFRPDDDRRPERANQSRAEQNGADDARRVGNAARFPRETLARGLPFSMRAETTLTSPLMAGEIRNTKREEALGAILAEQGVAPLEIIVVTRPLMQDPVLRKRPRQFARLIRDFGGKSPVMLAAIRKTTGPQWTVVRVVSPPSQSGALRSIVGQTILIFLFLMTLQFLVLRRIIKPLKLLTERTEQFARKQNLSQPLAPEGPEDIRRLIAAHNAMEARIAALLDEKDVMLGAIGHDLKTPLSALRVRIESVEDEAERGRMAATIEDITRSLDDILSLARVGKGNDDPERAELSALASSVVEEFEDMGEPVTLGEASRMVHPIHVTWMRRALRNLISNAVRYGGSAQVSLLREGAEIVLRVEDSGPGIAEGRIDAMLEPFTRGEASRNRDTGGAGLGLTLARAIAEQHNGRLVLSNRPSGGLRADIRLPVSNP